MRTGTLVYLEIVCYCKLHNDFSFRILEFKLKGVGFQHFPFNLTFTSVHSPLQGMVSKTKVLGLTFEVDMHLVTAGIGMMDEQTGIEGVC